MFFLHLVKYAFCILYFLKLKKEITPPRKRRYVSDDTQQKEFTTIHLPRWSVCHLTRMMIQQGLK